MRKGLPPRPDVPSLAGFVTDRPRRWPWVFFGCLIAGGALLWIAGLVAYASHDHPGGFIGDETFVDAANETCREAFLSKPPPAVEDATNEERARAVERGHRWMTALVDEIASLPVRSTDLPEVRWWIARWRELLTVGEEYASAIRTADPEVYVPIGNLGDAPVVDINEFAKNNGIDSCVM